MSLIGMPQDWRLAMFNGLQSGPSLSHTGSLVPTIVGRRVRFDSNGALSYETTTTTFFSLTASLGAMSYVAGSAFSNTASGWLGGEFLISIFASGGASGSVLVFLETSPDGGVTWPTSGGGTASLLNSAATIPFGATIVAAIGFGSVVSVISNASSIMRVNFNL